MPIQFAGGRWLWVAGLAAALPHGAAAGFAVAVVAPPVEVVKVGVFMVAPYVVAGANGPGGVLIDFFDREVAPRMGVRFKWERPMTTARLEQSLISGSVMFTPILARTAQRERAGIRFAGAVHIRFDPCIALLPEHPLDKVVSAADLYSITVGWVQAGALPPFMLDKRIRLDRVGSVDWTAANLEKLKLGRIGAAYFSNHYTPEFFAARTGMRLKLLSLPTKGTDLYGAFSPKASPALIERYRRAAAEAFADDKFVAYLQKAMVVEPPAAPSKP